MNPDESIFNKVIDILLLPWKIITWPFRKFMQWAYKGVGE